MSADQKILLVGPTRDQREYLAGLNGYFDPAKPCQDCGAPMGEHVIGGPGPFHPRPLKPASYDQGCFDLAERFLEDEPPRIKALVHRMATEMQQWIEDWIGYEQRGEIMHIIVNGKRHDVPRGRVDYLTIAVLVGQPDSRELSVTYHWRGEGDLKRDGILAPGESIEGDVGMIFNAVHTGNA